MSEIHYNTQGSIARLFSQLKGQQVRLTIVAISIIIYIGLSIWNPMYSAIVIDHLWQSIPGGMAKTALPSRSAGRTWDGSCSSCRCSTSAPGSSITCSLT